MSGLNTQGSTSTPLTTRDGSEGNRTRSSEPSIFSIPTQTPSTGQTYALKLKANPYSPYPSHNSLYNPKPHLYESYQDVRYRLQSSLGGVHPLLKGLMRMVVGMVGGATEGSGVLRAAKSNSIKLIVIITHWRE